MGKVPKTTTMGVLVVKFESKGGARAWGEQEVVAANGVGSYGQHFVATVGKKGMTYGQIDCIVVVERAAVGQDFSSVMKVVGEKIGDLKPFRVDDGQALAFM